MWAQSFSCVWLFVTLWSVAHQAPLFMGLSQQEYWSGLRFPPPGDFPHLGMGPGFLASPALSGRFFATEPPQNSDSVYEHMQSTLVRPCLDSIYNYECWEVVLKYWEIVWATKIHLEFIDHRVKIPNSRTWLTTAFPWLPASLPSLYPLCHRTAFKSPKCCSLWGWGVWILLGNC